MNISERIMLMEAMVVWGSCLIAAYLGGAIPFGYIVGRMRGVDIRTVGSKNIGATNVYRSVGHGWGLLVFACDFAKGVLPALICSLCFSGRGAEFANLPLCAGVASVIGHTLTVFMRFRGGKGVATAFGVFMALAPYPSLIAFGVFVFTVWLSHYISLGSILAAITLGITVWLFPATIALRVVAGLIALFVILKHRSNISRIINGCENRIW